MLKYGPKVEAKAVDILHSTGLCHMAWLRDLESTRFFIEQGGNVNAQNKDGETALTESSRHGNVDVVKLLLEHGSNLEVALHVHHWTPLLQAVRDNRLEVAKVLLDYGANMHAKLLSGNDAVAEACFYGYHEIARSLIERGSRLESLNFAGQTPLFEASRRNDDDWTCWLLRRVAKIDVRDGDGWSPVWHAANGGHHRSLATLLEYNSPTDTLDNGNWLPLGCAAYEGHYECVKLLLDVGADTNVHQAHGSSYTSLCEASHHGRVDVVRLFLERGANMEIGSKSGFSALSVAEVNGQDAVVRVLAEAGADLNKPGFTKKDPNLSPTPLMRATIAEETSTALLLIELGASINLCDAEGKTALLHAAEQSNPAVVAALLARGADVNARSTRKQETALMHAVVRGNIEVALLLLEAKANTSLEEWRGRPAWVLAKQHNQDRKLEPLLGPGHVGDDAEVLRKSRKKARSMILRGI